MSVRLPYLTLTDAKKIVTNVAPLTALYLTTFWLLYTPGDLPQIILSFALTVPLVWLTLCDLRSYELPNRGTLAVALIAVFFLCMTSPDWLFLHLITGAAIFGLLWLVGEIYYRKAATEGLGIGDAKLFGAGAVLLGPFYLPDLFLLSSLGGILGWIFARKSRDGGIPFGPFIAYAIFVLSFLNPLFL